ncbi:MAG: alpha/beta hydrolase-fold protein [Ginsengibacter sp.]|jgi:enterochelin esterase-like enzyme
MNLPIFGSNMISEDLSKTFVDSCLFNSQFLKREVTIDFYFPPGLSIGSGQVNLLLINDGQDLVTMDFHGILDRLYSEEKLLPILCVGIHCGPDRRNEYGTTDVLDFMGRGAKANLYTQFIFEELFPLIYKESKITSFKEQAFCGFSLGGLSALDIVWGNAAHFNKVGVFSGSLWWRTVDQEELHFNEEGHRIMHNKVREGDFVPWLRFFFETGILDEVADRNNNGIIDSIDDTVSLIDELKKKGYKENDIRYLELSDGGHNVATWARALPEFLKWGWGI